LLSSKRHITLHRALIFIGALLSFSVAGQDSSKTHVLKVVPIDGYQKESVHTADLTSASPRYELGPSKMLELGIINVGDAMRFVPGAQLKDYGGLGGVKTVSYRSLGATHTAVISDWNTQYNFQQGMVDLGGINAFGIQSLAFNSGQPSNPILAASSYLPASFIESVSEIALQDTALTAQVQQTASTVNQFSTAANINVPIKKKGFFATQLSSIYGNGHYPYQYNLTGTNEPFTRSNTEMLKLNGQLSTGFRHKNSFVRLMLSHFEQTQNLPGAVILFNPSHDQSLNTTGTRADVNYRFLTEKWLVTSHLNYSRNFTHYHDPTYLNAAGYIDQEYVQQITEGGFMLNRLLRAYKERVFIGADVVYGDLESAALSASPQRLGMNSVAGTAFWLGPLKIEGNVAHQLIQDEFISGDSLGQNTYSKFSPYVGLSIQPFKKVSWKIRSFYKNAFRMPTFNDLYYNFIGNIDLKPEDAHLSNFGMTYGFQQKGEHKWSIELSVDGFYNIVDNKIVAIPTKDLFNWSMQNIGRTQIQGIDANLSVSFKLGHVLINASTSHTINQSVDITDESSLSYGHQIPYTPLYASSHTFMIDYHGYQITSNLIHQGVRYSLNENISSNQLPAFNDWSVGLQKAFDFDKDHDLFVSLKCNNVLNNNFEVIRSFPMPGRHFLCVLKYQFK